jgi:hypothetical protein
MGAYVLPGRRPGMPPSNETVAVWVLGGDPSLGNELK